MIDYTGMECPVCGKPFTKDDDIVVCPECGAPHHRECYAAHGRCGCAEQHGTSQAWDKVHENRSTKKACPFCQGLNEEDAVFCSHCGRALSEPGPQQNGNPQGQPYGAPPFNGQQPFNGQPPFGGQPFPGANTFHISPQDELEDGVTYGEAAQVVRSNVPFYMMVFYRIKNLNRNRFNFAAFFFGASWLLYRKQYKTAGIFIGINAVLTAASLLVSTFVSGPILQNIYNNLGITDNTLVTNTLMNQVSDAIRALDTGHLLLLALPMVFSLMALIVNIVLGAKANRWYLNHCVQTAKRVRQEATTPMEQEAAYQKRGGVNMALAMALLVIYVLANYLPMML
ncbi:MAG: RING finger protein [Oscillospiraceae bacterium]|nr:RING finger protein [Oscillospiraceae bacterium]